MSSPLHGRRAPVPLHVAKNYQFVICFGNFYRALCTRRAAARCAAGGATWPNRDLRALPLHSQVCEMPQARCRPAAQQKSRLHNPSPPRAVTPQQRRPAKADQSSGSSGWGPARRQVPGGGGRGVLAAAPLVHLHPAICLLCLSSLNCCACHQTHAAAGDTGENPISVHALVFAGDWSEASATAAAAGARAAGYDMVRGEGWGPPICLLAGCAATR